MQENINSNGKKSDVIVTLPITSTQTLCYKYTDKGVINKIDFKVTKMLVKYCWIYILCNLYGAGS